MTQFAAKVIDFVMRAQQQTKAAYDASMSSPTMEPDERLQRVYNMNLKGKELEKALKKPELTIVPRVSNTAFKNADGVLVKMYIDGVPATHEDKKTHVVSTLEQRIDLDVSDQPEVRNAALGLAHPRRNYPSHRRQGRHRVRVMHSCLRLRR